ncbi:MAG: hypothetical protein ACYCQI_12110 [Gammaproteobacteria bacterium]
MTIVRHDLLIKTIKSAQRPLHLSHEIKHDGKLLIKNFNFYTLGPELTEIDFTDCILDHCDFSYQVLNQCQFAKSQFQDVKTNLTTFDECTLPADFKPSLEEDTQWPGSWIDYMLSRYPENILQFQHITGEHKLNSLFQSKTVIESGDNYRFTNKTYLEKNAFYNGWDLLIRIAKADLAKCFDLIAPILYRWFHAFTLEINDETCDNIVFRIHLLEDIKGKPILYFNSLKLSDETLNSVLANIDFILKKNQIRQEKKSSSQGDTFSEYFSIQNRFDLQLAEIFSQAICNITYNPINKTNPYVNFLKIKPPLFDASVHFTSLAAQIDFATAIRLSLLAYLNECLNNKTQNTEAILQIRFFLKFFTSSEFLLSPEKISLKPELFFSDTSLDKLFNTIELERCKRNTLPDALETQDETCANKKIINERLLQYFCLELNMISQSGLPLGLRLDNIFNLINLVKKNHLFWQQIIFAALTMLTPFLQEALQNGCKPQMVAQLKKLFKPSMKNVQNYLDELESQMIINSTSIIRFLKSQYPEPTSSLALHKRESSELNDFKISEKKPEPIYTGDEVELPTRSYEIEYPCADPNCGESHLVHQLRNLT